MNGSEAELQAEKFLQDQNLVPIARNYRCRLGEIDLIMREGNVLVFVEVRLRRSIFFGGAASSITPAKQGKLMRAAKHYLSTLNKVPPCRFDAVLLTGKDGEGVEWIKNAFWE